MIKKIYLLSLILTVNSLTNAMNLQKTEQLVFDHKNWNQRDNNFSHHKNYADNIVSSIKGAGILPVFKDSNNKLYFLFMVATVENGQDKNIGNELVYTNPSNYPLNEGELSIDMAARPEELGIISEQFTKNYFTECINNSGSIIPNTGMRFGNYAVPTYIILLNNIDNLVSLLSEAKTKIATNNDYDKLFPTESSIKRTDKITQFDLVSVENVIKAIKAQTNRIEKPLNIDNANFKLSPYVARTLAFVDNLKIIEAALESYK